jgi:lysozyme family protein
MRQDVIKKENLSPEGMFDYAIEFVLKHEGGFVNSKKDPGGATNYGVSLRFLKAAGLDIDLDGDVDVNDILALDKDRAREIYRRFWWNKYHYWGISDSDIAKKILDMSVHMGAKQAHKIAQIAVNRLCDKPIAVDGLLGPETFRAINKLVAEGKTQALYDELKDNAAHFYINLAADVPELKLFLKGWLRRADD